MGHSRGGLTTKIHALEDAEGRPIHLLLTAGQAGDAPVGRELLARLAPGGILLADKAYDTDAIRAETAERGGFANVPARTNRKRTFSFSPWLYRQRNLVERVFNRIKQMRASPAATTGARTTPRSPQARRSPHLDQRIVSLLPTGRRSIGSVPHQVKAQPSDLVSDPLSPFTAQHLLPI